MRERDWTKPEQWTEWAEELLAQPRAEIVGRLCEMAAHEWSLVHRLMRFPPNGPGNSPTVDPGES